MAERRNGGNSGTAEQRNGGTAERRNGGTAERWKGGRAEGRKGGRAEGRNWLRLILAEQQYGYILNLPDIFTVHRHQ